MTNGVVPRGVRPAVAMQRLIQESDLRCPPIKPNTPRSPGGHNATPGNGSRAVDG